VDGYLTDGNRIEMERKMKKILLVLGTIVLMTGISEAVSKYKITTSTKTIGYTILGSQKYQICADTGSAAVVTISSYTLNFGGLLLTNSTAPYANNADTVDGQHASAFLSVSSGTTITELLAEKRDWSLVSPSTGIANGTIADGVKVTTGNISATGGTSADYLQKNGTWSTPAGAGDMVQADINTYTAIVNTTTVQTIAGDKTFTGDTTITVGGGVIQSSTSYGVQLSSNLAISGAVNINGLSEVNGYLPANITCADNAYYRIVFSSITKDNLSEWDVASSSFVAKSSGRFLIDVHASWGGVAAGRRYLFIMKNGVDIYTDLMPGVAAENIGHSISQAISIDKGDTISFRVYVDAATTSAGLIGAPLSQYYFTYFSIQQIYQR